MAKCGDPKTLAVLRGVARMVEGENNNGAIIDLEDGRYLTLVVAHDDTGQVQ